MFEFEDSEETGSNPTFCIVCNSTNLRQRGIKATCKDCGNEQIFIGQIGTNKHPNIKIQEWPLCCPICQSKNLLTLNDENPPVFIIGCEDCAHAWDWVNTSQAQTND